MSQALQAVPPRLATQPSAPENALRGTIIDLLGRIGVFELPKQFVPELIAACHAVLLHDTEDHGVVAQRILFDLHKAYKQSLEEQSGAFFDWLQKVST